MARPTHPAPTPQDGLLQAAQNGPFETLVAEAQPAQPIAMVTPEEREAELRATGQWSGREADARACAGARPSARAGARADAERAVHRRVLPLAPARSVRLRGLSARARPLPRRLRPDRILLRRTGGAGSGRTRNGDALFAGSAPHGCWRLRRPGEGAAGGIAGKRRARAHLRSHRRRGSGSMIGQWRRQDCAGAGGRDGRSRTISVSVVITYWMMCSNT